MEFRLSTLLIYTVVILLILLIISFIWDAFVLNKMSNEKEGFIDQRSRRKIQIKEDDINVPISHVSKLEHLDVDMDTREFTNKADKLTSENAIDIFKKVRKFIKKGASEFSKLIDCDVKEEISIKVCNESLNDSRYLVIFDTEEEAIQKKLHKNYGKLLELCHVDKTLLDFGEKKLDKMDWKCCELIYGIDAIGMTEKIYICDARTRNIFAMEKNGKVYTKRFYKAVDKFVSSGDYKTELESLLGDKTGSYIKHLKKENWSDFTYRKTVDGKVSAYNIILKKNYTVGEYKTHLVNLAKDVCNKKSSSTLNKKIGKYTHNIISWIGVSSSGFTIYIRL